MLKVALDESDEGQLALLRRTRGESSFGVHYRFDTRGPVQFLDASVEPDTVYEYAAAELSGEDVIGASQATRVHWLAPPAPPTATTARALGQHIELAWKGCSSCGAVVFRRKLGERQYTRLPVMAAAGEHRFVDRPGEPGVVFGYTISQVIWSDDLPIVGSGCAEVYVEAMPAGSLLQPEPEEPAGPGEPVAQ